ncbi:MAG TPA: transposase [Nonomuraea sp.]|uniref:transposase n=1 Tax=Nonomuraea sp. NPDC049649 TaxID=3155776 RepID=UPI002CB425D2|nr:transposase [Nonomuraea sp.]
MDRRWVGSHGYEIVPAVLDGRQVLRVRRDGRLVADCTSVAEVARLVDLADLCEVVEFPARPRQAGRTAAQTSSHHG